MSSLIDDVKSGIKGIHGAGEAIRGKTLEATDQVFDKNPTHPETVVKQQDNRNIAEKGKQDIRGADETLARREWEKKGAIPPAGTLGAEQAKAPVTTATTTTQSHATGAPVTDVPLQRQPGAHSGAASGYGPEGRF